MWILLLFLTTVRVRNLVGAIFSACYISSTSCACIQEVRGLLENGRRPVMVTHSWLPLKNIVKVDSFTTAMPGRAQGPH